MPTFPKPIFAGAAAAVCALGIGAAAGLLTKSDSKEPSAPTAPVVNQQASAPAVEAPRLDALQGQFAGQLTLVANGDVCPGFLPQFTEGITIGLQKTAVSMTLPGGSTFFGTVDQNGQLAAADKDLSVAGLLKLGTTTQNLKFDFTLTGSHCVYDGTAVFPTPFGTDVAVPPPAFTFATPTFAIDRGRSDSGPGWGLAGGGAAVAVTGGTVLYMVGWRDIKKKKDPCHLQRLVLARTEETLQTAEAHLAEAERGLEAATKSGEPVTTRTMFPGSLEGQTPLTPEHVQQILGQQRAGIEQLRQQVATDRASLDACLAAHPEGFDPTPPTDDAPGGVESTDRVEIG